MKGSLTNRKFAILPGLLICNLLILSLMFPERGTILGIRFHIVMFAALILGFIFTGKIIVNAPKFFMAYAAIELSSLIIHFNTLTSTYYVLNFIPIIIVYYVIVSCVTTENIFDKVLDFIVFLFAIYALLGIVEGVLHTNIFDILTNTQVQYSMANEIRFGIARTRGAANISINNGMMLILVLCAAAYKVINTVGKRKKYYVIAYFLIMIDIFLTISRANWLGILVSQLIIFIHLSSYRKYSIVYKLIIGLVLGFGVLLVAAPDLLWQVLSAVGEMVNSILGVVGLSDGADNLSGEGHRFKLWGWVWEKVQDEALFGVGFDRPFSYRLTSSFNKESIEVMWLNKLYKTGFFGLAGFITFQVGSLTYLWKNYKKTVRSKELLPDNSLIKREKIGFNYVVFAAAITYFVLLFSCSGFEDLRFFYILISLAFAYNKIRKSKTSLT